MTVSTTSRAFFEAKYQGDRDPWDFASSAYEQGRYSAIVAALAGRRYRHCFEPGCSIGVLTERLGTLCERIDAVDISPTAAEEARARCAHLPQITVRVGSLAATLPPAPLDLIVFSEIGYYSTEAALREILRALIDRMEPGGTLLAAHWLGYSIDHVLSGDQVHAALHAMAGLRHEHAERHSGFRLDRWVRV